MADDHHHFHYCFSVAWRWPTIYHAILQYLNKEPFLLSESIFFKNWISNDVKVAVCKFGLQTLTISLLAQTFSCKGYSWTRDKLAAASEFTGRSLQVLTWTCSYAKQYSVDLIPHIGIYVPSSMLISTSRTILCIAYATILHMNGIHINAGVRIDAEPIWTPGQNSFIGNRCLDFFLDNYGNAIGNYNTLTKLKWLLLSHCAFNTHYCLSIKRSKNLNTLISSEFLKNCPLVFYLM